MAPSCLFEHHIAADRVWSFQAQQGLTSSYGHSRSDKLQKTFFFPVHHMDVFICKRASAFWMRFLLQKCPNTNHSRLILPQQVGKLLANVVQHQLSSAGNDTVSTLYNKEKQTKKKKKELECWINVYICQVGELIPFCNYWCTQKGCVSQHRCYNHQAWKRKIEKQKMKPKEKFLRLLNLPYVSIGLSRLVLWYDS